MRMVKAKTLVDDRRGSAKESLSFSPPWFSCKMIVPVLVLVSTTVVEISCVSTLFAELWPMKKTIDQLKLISAQFHL